MWADRILASPLMQAVSPLRAMALMSSGMLALWQGKQDIGLAQLQESLAILQKLEDRQWLASRAHGEWRGIDQYGPG